MGWALEEGVAVGGGQREGRDAVARGRRARNYFSS
jgi:hypothetical protein